MAEAIPINQPFAGSLAAPLGAADTSLTLLSGHGVRFSDPSGDTVRLLIVRASDGAIEYLTFDTRVNDVLLNLSRGAEAPGDSALEFAIGDTVIELLTKGGLTALLAGGGGSFPITEDGKSIAVSGDDLNISNDDGDLNLSADGNVRIGGTVIHGDRIANSAATNVVETTDSGINLSSAAGTSITDGQSIALGLGAGGDADPGSNANGTAGGDYVVTLRPGGAGDGVGVPGRQGQFVIVGLPTSDPGVAGAFWNNGGAPAISAG